MEKSKGVFVVLKEAERKIRDKLFEENKTVTKQPRSKNKRTKKR